MDILTRRREELMEQRERLITSHLSSERGVALVAVMMVLVVVGLLGGSAIVLNTQATQLSERTYSDKLALYTAESGKEQAYSLIFNDSQGNVTTLENPYAVSNETLQGGAYDLEIRTLSESPKVIEIISTGHMGGAEKQVTVVSEVFRENVSVWNNAVFGGAGQPAGVVLGYSRIHGSVHLLGDNVAPGNIAMGMIDTNGNALIANNYDGISAELLAKVPPIPTTVFAGETISTLNAKVRVRNGAVGLSGNSQIGTAQETGNSFKETMDGIFIETDYADLRWTGNNVTEGVPDPAYVHSDNGADALYDLVHTSVTRPLLSDPYTDPSSGIAYDSFEACFAAKALHLPPLVLDSTNSAMLAIQNHSFGPGVTTGFEGDAFVVYDGTNKIFYNPTTWNGTSRLHVSGRILIDGDLDIGDSSRPVMYSGRGTMFAAGGGSGYGDIGIHSDLLPIGMFAIDDVLGLMAKRDLNLGTGSGDSQILMAAACYAGEGIMSAKQSQMAGTFVCNYLDMGTNVPSIFQVPELANNVPPGLIGAEPIWATLGFEERSWSVD
jgi:hypothetical protein